MKRRKPQPTWEDIASFYAGRPIKISEDKRGPMNATTGLPESGNVLLGKSLLSGLADFRKQWDLAERSRGRARQDALQRALTYGVNPLATLIHEAIHNRHFESGPSAGAEPQAMALGAELIPDLMQRFFGVRLGSPLSRKWGKAAKGRGEYKSAYDLAEFDGWNPILFAPIPTRRD